MTIEEYATKYLSLEIQLIESSQERLNILPELTVYEKAIIFKYSEDGYEDLNEKLRLSGGKDISIFGILLDECLNKLPDYQGRVYRGVSLNKYDLNRYLEAFQNNILITESFFISTSESQLASRMFGRNVQFQIISKKGKSIREIAKFEDEREVLFRHNTCFEILDISHNQDVIIMKEINGKA
ncbi:ADP-ribosyltransferase exoenzyme [Arcicella aurantiaca]|uniref:ADP-ribosyltransferase exoenzyme n=1 Tax=Arcicella aurantiaca TaxID=591202 RepID=A0A316EGM8_9BACT|nr:ADP-ribosyltransferase [Arcicella aurantiaca]PWK28904.1 ADP-ribosyltransferase exoenzyme [Arcicella aurantiaca]